MSTANVNNGVCFGESFPLLDSVLTGEGNTQSVFGEKMHVRV
jgi:hypothetical protein